MTYKQKIIGFWHLNNFINGKNKLFGIWHANTHIGKHHTYLQHNRNVENKGIVTQGIPSISYKLG